jgi:hypothetical protein
MLFSQTPPWFYILLLSVVPWLTVTVAMVDGCVCAKRKLDIRKARLMTNKINNNMIVVIRIMNVDKYLSRNKGQRHNQAARHNNAIIM